MKRTPWFPGTTHPARRGWYERDHRNCWQYINPDDRRITLDLWEPVNTPGDPLFPGVWYVSDQLNWPALLATGEQWIQAELNDASHQSLPWRGLMEKAT